MRKPELLTALIKILLELGAIISLDILDLAIKQIIETVEEVPGIVRTMGRIHPGKSYFGVFVDSGNNISFLAHPVKSYRIKTEKKAFQLFHLKISDLLPFLG